MSPAAPQAIGAPLVLVVDDNPLNERLARFVLESDGLQVASAADADEALQLLQGLQPALILMDIHLPGRMDGLALTRQLKTDTRWQGVPVVAFTAFAMAGDEQRCREAGCDGYITKPIEVARFAAEVRALMAMPDRR